MENQERIENQETQEEQEIQETEDTQEEETITITKADYTKAIKDEVNSVMNDLDSKSIGAPLMIAMAGSAFAMAVWGRLTGQKD